jgi:hypothetical protein
MLRRLALIGDASESTPYAEEECGEDLVDETAAETARLGVGVIRVIGVLVDMRRRFDTGESCVVGIKLLPDLPVTVLCTCEWYPSENTS